jgi:Domain of unknown function (DUF5664)
MTFRLEVGKQYRRRDGGGPVLVTGTGGIQGTRQTYVTKTSIYWVDGRKDYSRESPSDLVAEWVDAHPAAPDTNPKTRIGLTKPSMRGIPSAAMIHLGGAMADGIAKYGIFNWREHAVSASVYEDAIWRHLMAWRDGEDTAQDSGRHHLAHVMACCAIMLDAMENGKLNDDRGPRGNSPAIIARMTQADADLDWGKAKKAP